MQWTCSRYFKETECTLIQRLVQLHCRWSLLKFSRVVNPIPIRGGGDYAHRIELFPPSSRTCRSKLSKIKKFLYEAVINYNVSKVLNNATPNFQLLTPLIRRSANGMTFPAFYLSSKFESKYSASCVSVMRQRNASASGSASATFSSRFY